jgi:hypothetical protein
MSLDDLVKEVQRKIGRNILLFQKLEYLLKYMVANASFSGYSSELEGIISSRKEAVNKQTMGQLVGQFVENSNPQNANDSTEPDVLKEPHFSFDFKMETDEDSYQEKKASLSKLVLERNNLVHHLLPELNPESFESCKKVERNLDKQADKVLLEIKNFQALAKRLSDGRKQLLDYMCSEEGEKARLLSFLRQDRLVILLGDIATQVAREDGWVLMNTAAQLLKQHAPDELALLHKGTEHKSLKSLMLKTEMFEFKEEKTKKGGMRVLYKLKDGYKLSYT